jgi:hypothetical protein
VLRKLKHDARANGSLVERPEKLIVLAHAVKLNGWKSSAGGVCAVAQLHTSISANMQTMDCERRIMQKLPAYVLRILGELFQNLGTIY